MQLRRKVGVGTVRTEGAILPADLLERIREGDPELGGLSPSDYHLQGERINEAISRSWSRLVGLWAGFKAVRQALPEQDLGTGTTRERWLLPLFQEFGYGRLQSSKAIELEGKSYAISHAWGHVPIQLVGFRVDLDRRMAGVVGAARMSPHGLVQELLNCSTGHVWGILSNGLKLRVLRDNTSLTRQAYVEFDLEAMFEGEAYADFTLMWLVCHQSRVEAERSGDCWLETWSKAAQEQGTRALDQLRDGVEEAISALGRGFLAHPTNKDLCEALRSGKLDKQEYYRQLLRLVYRLIFLFVAEDRGLLFDPRSKTQARERYLRFYSMTHLRELAESRAGTRHGDLYHALKLVMDALGHSDGCPELGLPALGSFLWSAEAIGNLNDCTLANYDLMEAVRCLGFTSERNIRRAVDYRNLGPEELGSIYEALLELQPDLNVDAGEFSLKMAGGSERRTTGSYYTPSSLIQQLLEMALDPVVGEVVSKPDPQGALLKLKVCDPACGSGHFLVAAAHRIARRLASVQTGDEEPSPDAQRHALRDVISHCVYGVDINPMAVELCKVNLWLESLEPGKPLSFLDAHIQCGDSLVGVSPNLDLSEIPDEAFNPAFSDDKATASALKKRNKRERGGSSQDGAGQLGFRFEATHITNTEYLARRLAEHATQVDAMPEDDSTQLQAKAKAFDELHATREYLDHRLELDLWTAAFFWRIPKADAESMLAPTQQELIQLRRDSLLDARLVETTRELATSLRVFHWKIAFPNVYLGDKPGFDCVLGNPPWENIKLQEEEFFATRDPKIAGASNRAIRQDMIALLGNGNPSLLDEFHSAKHSADVTSKFIRYSGRFPLSAVGDINTYALFAELAMSLVTNTGLIGIVIPTGIVTDDPYKGFFEYLIQNRRLIELIGFENEEFLFPGIANVVRFCLFVASGGDSMRFPRFGFYLRKVEQIGEKLRFFQVDKHDFELFNPNTLTCPVFRTQMDYSLTKEIYRRVPILKDERNRADPWKVQLSGMFHMSNDSELFHAKAARDSTPLYEAKLFWHYDHRFASYDLKGKMRGKGGRGLPSLPLEFHQDPKYSITPQYWIANSEVDQRVPEFWTKQWLLAYRRITSAKLERTTVFSILPRSGVGDSATVLFLRDIAPERLVCCLLANANSLGFDYLARQKVSGTVMNHYFMWQLPVLPPNAYTPADIDFIVPRVVELVYTAYDLRPFAEDMGYHVEPFRWDEVRRAQVRAELDAYYARLYGLSRDELRYILDPQDVYGQDFPGETFRVLKEKELKQLGEFRTARLILDTYDEMQRAMQSGVPYQTRLDPPAADPRCCHPPQ